MSMFRNVKIRFKILRNNSVYGEIYAKDSPTLSMNRESEIKMSLNGVFLPTATDIDGREVEVDWLSDEIQPVIDINGIEYPLAVVMPASVVPSESETTKELHVEAYDRCWRVSDTRFETVLHLSAGTNYVSAIETLLLGCGVETILKTESEATLTEDREWDIGTSYLEVVNQLLSEINYEKLSFNENGIAMIKPIRELSVENAVIAFTDKTVDPRDPKSASIINIMPEISITNDIYKAPNVFVCVCSNPDKSDVMIAKAENTNPQSPLSIQRRGRRIVDVVRVDNIASQEELQAYVNNIRNESMITGEVYTIKTLLLPGIRTSDIVALQVNGAGAICIEEQWEMILGIGGSMTHQLKRVVINVG